MVHEHIIVVWHKFGMKLRQLGKADCLIYIINREQYLFGVNNTTKSTELLLIIKVKKIYATK